MNTNFLRSWFARTAAGMAACCGLLAGRALGNDACGNAVLRPVPVTVFGSTTGATVDVELPGCGDAISSPGVWYRVIGTGTTMTAATCDPLTNYDTIVSVYCGSCTTLSCVGSNDNFCGQQSSVSWCSVAGANYYILVHGANGESGNFFLHLDESGPPCTPSQSCASYGACCIAGACSIRTPASCLSLGGAYGGDYSNCDAGGPTEFDYSATPNAPIGDLASVDSTILVLDSFTVGDVNVIVNIPDHTYIGDLVLLLQHEASQFSIWWRYCSFQDGLDIELDDEGAFPVCSSPTIGNMKTAGFFSRLLAEFDGGNSAGGWTLTVSDAASGDTGTLVSWGLRLRPPGAQACDTYAVGDLNCDGAVNILDINPFTLALADPAGYAATFPSCDINLADINGDHSIDILDINPFVALLSGG
ncbi:hypothetical protein RAS1_03700 [Phycisphaerae bacterium RAS1]|nr:hypothetical protein RAS1_03700 [Phycisphaerae bacterium RAS1]